MIVCTGGIGPTKDDLTRQVLAAVAGVELELRPEIEDHIRNIFANYGREMPENNRVQAFFPIGSNIIPNAEGTAPGIDVIAGNSRIFALPGVPYEMKEMWNTYIQPQLLASGTAKNVIKHHVVHCFGAGESQIELMLEGMTDRDHVPRVGITASKATISMRIAALAKSEDECDEQIATTVRSIEDKLGELVFGANGQELQDVLVELLRQRELTVSILDFGFGGGVGLALSKADTRASVLQGAVAKTRRHWRDENSIEETAAKFRQQMSTDIAVVVSPAEKAEDQRFYEIAICSSDETVVVNQKYAGHSGLIEDRTVKQILNQVRLFLMK